MVQIYHATLKMLTKHMLREYASIWWLTEKCVKVVFQLSALEVCEAITLAFSAHIAHCCFWLRWGSSWTRFGAWLHHCCRPTQKNIICDTIQVPTVILVLHLAFYVSTLRSYFQTKYSQRLWKLFSLWDTSKMEFKGFVHFWVGVSHFDKRMEILACSHKFYYIGLWLQQSKLKYDCYNNNIYVTLIFHHPVPSVRNCHDNYVRCFKDDI